MLSASKSPLDRVAAHVRDMPPSGIRDFFEIVSTMKDVISLGIGEPDFASPWKIRESAIYSLERGVTHYTSNLGLLSLRKAIAGYLGQTYQLDYNPADEILVTVGVSEGLDLALRAILEPGDEVIYHESNETFICFIQKSKNEEYLFIGSSSTVSDEYRYLPLKHPSTGWQIFLPRQRHLEYSLEHHRGYFFIRTNWEAINFRLMQCPVDRTGKDYWEEVLPHDPAGYLDDIEVFQDHLVTLSRAGASKEVRIFDLNTMASFNVPFPEEARNVEFDRNPEFAANKVRVQYTSLITPPSVIDVHLGNGEQEVLKVQEVVGGYEASDYHTERIWAEGVDGTSIPVSLVYRKDLWKPSKSPGLLYGYGSYGISIDPYFSIPRLSLLDRGFVYAIAHIRGGQELGRDWYEAGKLKAKRNTFEDFIACGQKLIDAQFVCAEGLAAMGGSAGGLLVGAAMNMAPGLFSAVVAAVPFVDVVTTMLDDSIPLTTGEYDEWGNPQEKAYYDLMKSYSPYDNIDSKPYPALLVTAGLHDSQVQYWEPAKWVAKLRDHTTEDHLIVLHTNLDAGHSGASGRFEKHRETALEYAFIIDQALCGPKSS